MSNIVKVCFILDCTSSMGSWIEAAKNKILDILDDLRNAHKDFKIFVSFIGYRDFGEHSYRINFTDNYQQIYNTITTIQALGGGDMAEDVSGAYRMATSLFWEGSIKTIFHITDAPNHGMMYHTFNISDDCPDGHPTVDLREEIRILANQNVDLTVFRLNKSTDIMQAIMKQEYTKIRLFGFKIVDFTESVENPSNVFYNEVYSHLTTSMTQDPIY